MKMSIANEITRLQNTKAALKTAINSKGGTITDESIHDYPPFVDNIAQLDTSDATAAGGDILLNKTAYANGVKITGTIQSLNANTFTPLLYDQTIDAGKYLAGVQTIKGDANLLAENIKSGVEMFGKTGTYSNESVNPITADFVLAGKVGFVNGTKITGSMTNRGAVSTDITTKTQVVTILQGYHNGSGSVQISSAEQAKIIPSNIVQGVTILGQAGSAKGMVGLSTNNVLTAPPTATYNHTTELNGWIGKTIIVEWQVSYNGDAGSAKLFEQSLTLNTSGKFIFYVVSSTSVRLTSTTTNITINSTSTQVGNIGGSTELTWSIYEA